MMCCTKKGRCSSKGKSSEKAQEQSVGNIMLIVNVQIFVPGHQRINGFGDEAKGPPEQITRHVADAK
jgi:hypothetical protein